MHCLRLSWTDSLLILALLCAPFELQGQEGKDPLKLSARVSRVVLKTEGNASARFEINLSLRFCNESSRSIILPKAFLTVIGERIFTDDSGAASYRSGHPNAVDRETDSVIRFRDTINQGAPPPEIFAIVRPSETYETTAKTSIYVLKKSKEDAEIWNAIRMGSPMILEVDVDLFPFELDVSSGEGFLDQLASRWASIGVLRTGQLRSGRFPISFPQVRE